MSITPGQERTKRSYRDIFKIEAADGAVYSISRADWQTRDRIRKAMVQDCSIAIKHYRFPNFLSGTLYPISSVSRDYIDCKNG
ncbi:MAG: hypothetical protein WC989_05500 [Micavibrio sp.]